MHETGSVTFGKTCGKTTTLEGTVPAWVKKSCWVILRGTASKAGVRGSRKEEELSPLAGLQSPSSIPYRQSLTGNSQQQNSTCVLAETQHPQAERRKMAVRLRDSCLIMRDNNSFMHLTILTRVRGHENSKRNSYD